MPAKSQIAQVAVNALESIKAPIGDVQKQVGALPTDFIKMMYGGDQAAKTEDELDNLRDTHSQIDAQKLSNARQTHEAMLGGTTRPTDSTPIRSTASPLSQVTGVEAPPVERAGDKKIVNVFNKGKITDDVTGQVMQTKVQELKANAEDLGIENSNDAANEKQMREKKEAEEKELAKQKKQQEMATLNIPEGKTTGFNPKRKKNPTRMQPPKTSENNASRPRE